MNFDRREALALIGLGALSPRAAAAPPQFFSPEEFRLVDTLAEMIIPADETSPGAREAKVAAYIDLVLANSPEEVRARWKSGLKAWAGLDGARLRTALDEASRKEERFFAELKRMTLFGYYTSEIGLRKDLGYQGNAVMHSFPGCPG